MRLCRRIRELAEDSRKIANSIQEISLVVIDSVKDLTGNSGKLLAYVDESILADYEKFAATCDLSGLKEEYESILANYNQPVRVLDPKEPFEGVALGITSTGELRVRKEDGTIAEVHSGEVSVRGLYSYV